MRTRCPICRARIPPSKEMVALMREYRTTKQRMEDNHGASSEFYHELCRALERIETLVGEDWDGVTVLGDTNEKLTMILPDYVDKAVRKGDVKIVLSWINANRTEDRANAVSNDEALCSTSALLIASINNQVSLMTLLLQLGADTDFRTTDGGTAIGIIFNSYSLSSGSVGEVAKLLLSWGANFFRDGVDAGIGCSREHCISNAQKCGKLELADLLKSELGGRRCEVVNLSSRPELNGKTCVADEYLPDSNQYKVTLEKKSKEVLVLSHENLKRRDRTPKDCGYYIEFKNGRTIRHDFDSSEGCQAFVATLNRDEESQPVVTEEAEARADQAAAELLAELGLDDSTKNNPHSDGQVKKTKKKKGGKKKKKK